MNARSMTAWSVTLYPDDYGSPPGGLPPGPSHGKTASVMLLHLRTHGPMTARQLVTATGMSIHTVRQYLSKPSRNRGRFERVPGSTLWRAVGAS